MFFAVISSLSTKAFIQGVCCALSLYVGKTPINTSKRKKR